MIYFYTIEIARTFCRQFVVFLAAVDVDGSVGAGAVELPAMPRQRVVDQIVDTGWIEKSTYFPHRRSRLA